MGGRVDGAGVRAPISGVRRGRASAIAALLLLAGGASGQTAFVWNAPVNGLWSDTGAWNPVGSPGAASTLDTATLGGVGVYTVDLTVSRTISGLSIPNADATLEIDRSDALTMLGDVTGAGRVVVNDAASPFNADLSLADGVMFDAAALVLTNATTSRLFGPTGAGERATLGPNSELSGLGRVIGLLDFSGTVRLNPGDLIRLSLTDNLMTGGGTVDFAGGEIDWSGVTVTNMNLVGDVDIDRSELVTIGAGVTFESSVVVGDVDSPFNAKLLLPDGVTLDNVVVDLRNQSTSFLEGPLNAGERATVGPGVTIIGSGRLNGLLDIAGDIILNPGQTIRLTQNDALLTGGGSMTFAGGDVQWNNATVTDFDLLGTVVLDSSEQIFVGQGVTFDSAVVVGDPASPFNSRLRLLDGVTLENVLVELRNSSTAYIDGPTGDGERATLASTVAVVGSGRFDGLLDIAADITVGPGQELRINLDDGLLTGGGRLDFAGGEVLWNNATVSNFNLAGDVDIDSSESVTFGAGVSVEDTITINDRSSPFVSNLRLLDGVVLAPMTVVLDNPTLARIAGPTDEGERARIGPGVVVRGEGRLNGALDIDGTLLPGTPDDPGTIQIRTPDPVAMSGSAELDIGVASLAPGDAGLLDNTAPLTLAGTLRVRPLGGFAVPFASPVPVVTGGTLTGRFDEIIYEGPLGANEVARVFYSSNRAEFAITCPGDVALPIGVLDVFDVIEFLALFDAQDPSTDLAAPAGVFDVFDVIVYLGLFDAGC